MYSIKTFVSAVVWVLLSTVLIGARCEADQPEDLTPCAGTRPQPTQSGMWGVAFCNRTGHDILIQFHDNDCPADNWSRRGDVYEKRLGPGESSTIALCYANVAQQSASPSPGVPLLRIPGGKGVVTTWNIVGDCGDQSDRVHLDERSFYDRGNYDSGIILLQHPAAPAHCVGSPTPAAKTETRPPVQPAAVARAAVAAGARPGGASAPESPPTLYATIDKDDRLTRTVHVFASTAQGAPNYRCTFTLALDLSDGSTWNDRLQVDVRSGAQDEQVSTRKYGKSVRKVALGSAKCSAT
jgi:hypothetical protein